MVSKRVEHTEIARAEITKNRSIVISRCSSGGFTIAQRVIIRDEDEGKEVPVFMKGAFHVNDIHGLYNLRDTLNLVIMEEENRDEDWDED